MWSARSAGGNLGPRWRSTTSSWRLTSPSPSASAPLRTRKAAPWNAPLPAPLLPGWCLDSPLHGAYSTRPAASRSMASPSCQPASRSRETPPPGRPAALGSSSSRGLHARSTTCAWQPTTSAAGSGSSRCSRRRSCTRAGGSWGNHGAGACSTRSSYSPTISSAGSGCTWCSRHCNQTAQGPPPPSAGVWSSRMLWALASWVGALWAAAELRSPHGRHALCARSTRPDARATTPSSS
mmetsp:Transcript_32496/g.88149  ORF Transcript_32496/g.88149 Transcript_32496/m.88149 type:complete len:237 (+) Transcript_32496:246-956(+)